MPLPLPPPTEKSLTPASGVSLAGASRAAPRPDANVVLPPLFLPPLPEPEPPNDAPNDTRDNLGLPLTVPLCWLLPPTGNGRGNVAGAAGVGGSVGGARPKRVRLTRGPAPLSDGSVMRVKVGGDAEDYHYQYSTKYSEYPKNIGVDVTSAK